MYILVKRESHTKTKKHITIMYSINLLFVYTNTLNFRIPYRNDAVYSTLIIGKDLWNGLYTAVPCWNNCSHFECSHVFTHVYIIDIVYPCVHTCIYYWYHISTFSHMYILLILSIIKQLKSYHFLSYDSFQAGTFIRLTYLCIHVFTAEMYRSKITRLFLKPGFHPVYYIGTMPRFVTIKTCFFWIIHCIKKYYSHFEH